MARNLGSWVPALCIVATSVLVGVGCSANLEKTQGEDLKDSGLNPDLGADTSVSDVGPETEFTFDGEPPKDADLPGEAAVYAHSSDVLYRIDPVTLETVEIGPFVDTKGRSPGQMTDIALDKDGVMYGVTFTALFRIDYKAAKPTCTQLASLGTEFNGLTFVPAGSVDPVNEVLIGISNDGTWNRIDVTAGATAAKVTSLGSYGRGRTSSGDAVGIVGDAVYATIVSSASSDVIAEIDPKTGAVKREIGATGVTGLWGVGYWGGVLYGFSKTGELYKIDLKTAKATRVALKNAPSGGFWGAGVTTRAPIIIK